MPVFNANSVDSDHTPRSVASEQGLHCLPMFLLGDACANGFVFIKYHNHYKTKTLLLCNECLKI